MTDRLKTSEREWRAEFAVFAARTFLVLLLTVLVLMAWYLSTMLLAVFAGLLLSVLLRNLSRRLIQFVPINETVALWAVIVLIIVAITLIMSLFGAQIATQFQQLIETIPDGVEQFQKAVERDEMLQSLLARLESIDPIATLGQGLLGPVTNIAVTAMQAVVGVLVILLIGIFLSVSPALYREGLVRLAPVSRRARAREILIETDVMLWQWLVGQIVAMIFVGAVTTAGLWLLNAPMAVALGLITGLLNFVPVLGPIMASIPAIMVGFTESPMLAFYILLLYVVVQQVESYVVLPVVQKWAVALPPVLTVVSIIAAGTLFGVAGAMLAVPLTVMLMGLVRMIYIETLLEGKGSPGDDWPSADSGAVLDREDGSPEAAPLKPHAH